MSYKQKINPYDGKLTVVADIPELKTQVIVNQSNCASTLGGVIDSTKAYFLDGVIDMGVNSITVPSTGINIKGFDFNTSGITSTEDNYTMFISPIGGSGDIVLDKMLISASGINSQVFDCTDASGFHALEWTAVNFNDCTSLGEVTDYRQGLESGTGRFGGSPSLILSGTWVGGFKITTSITRNMSDTTTSPLFCAGTAFVMNSRFFTDMNVDLGTLQPLLDFSPTNFLNPSTLQLQGMEVTRDFIYNPDDANITPNIDNTNLVSLWRNNNGMPNTYVGAVLGIASEVVTAINTIGVYEVLEGTFASSDLQHFDHLVNGQLKNIGNNPRHFKIVTYIVLDGSANDVISIRLRKFKFVGSVTTTIVSQLATINNFSGGNDRCTFSILGREELDINDYYFMEVANLTSTDNVTAKLGTFTSIEER